jgi:Na+-translocating ferredoxin:NAD+ oxidoreductase RnfG subunit
MGSRLPHFVLAATSTLAGSTSGYAATYLTTEQAKAALFPGVALLPVQRTLTATEAAAIEQASGMRVRSLALRLWRAPDGSWLVVDDVLGKHEFITYAVALTPGGAVHQVEIMDYRETYGAEVRNEKWRAQFVGKTVAAPLKLDEDIKNISGATLSCRHVTDGVKRLLATHALVLQHLP